MTLKRIALILFGSWLACAPAIAEQISEFNVGNWRGGGYTHTKTGDFSHCAASADYKNGVTLVFAIHRDLTWSLGLANDNWKLTEGDTYAVQYQIDRSSIYDGTATVIAPNQVKVPLPGDDALFGRFRRGRMLTIDAANQTMNFSLKHTSKMLGTLFECAQYWRHKYQKPKSNPLSGDSSSNPFASD